MFNEVYSIHTTFRKLALLLVSGRICIIKPVLLVPLDPSVLYLHLFLQVSRLTFLYVFIISSSLLYFI